MQKIIAFEPNYNPIHRKVLRALAQGIPDASIRTLGNYKECDIAIIFGAHKESYKATFPKKEILELHQGRRLLMVESAFVKRKEYYQVGWGGFAGNADFNNVNSPPDRWLKMGIDVKPWKPWRFDADGFCLVIGQVPWDTQVQDTDHAKWCRDTIAHLESIGERVKFRPHPKVVEKNKQDMYGIDNKYFDTAKSFSEAVKGAKFVVTYNSTSVIDSLIEGVPAIACDRGSIAWQVCGVHGLHNVNDLSYLFWIWQADRVRDHLFANIGYAQWTLDEMRKGLTWNHLTK